MQQRSQLLLATASSDCHSQAQKEEKRKKVNEQRKTHKSRQPAARKVEETSEARCLRAQSTLLSHAVEEGRVQDVHRILSDYPQLLERAHKYRPTFAATPFIAACFFNRAQVVRCLVDRFKCDTAAKAQLNWARYDWQPTGWELDVHYGHVKVFDFLTETVKSARSLPTVMPRVYHQPPVSCHPSPLTADP